MSAAIDALSASSSVLVVDWPSQDVPDSLARAGYQVFVKGGPGPRDYSIRERRGSEVVARPATEPPDHIDLVYSHRPLSELAGIAAMAARLGAHTVWRQSGRSGPGTGDPKGCWVSEQETQEGRSLVEAEGLSYIDDVYIGDAVRELAASRETGS